ncbi:hypothetical protein CDAR_3461 [Caerostris darwini]|uniref:Ycf15 n=1 Tax=Caerostris darwini TaxID=1538125 RepID=A0AAV4QVV9_9ARAC|nr:hypothetical protein CDAR_3461 [Caerostris darwini]
MYSIYSETPLDCHQNGVDRRQAISFHRDLLPTDHPRCIANTAVADQWWSSGRSLEGLASLNPSTGRGFIPGRLGTAKQNN